MGVGEGVAVDPLEVEPLDVEPLELEPLDVDPLEPDPLEPDVPWVSEREAVEATAPVFARAGSFPLAIRK